MTARFLITWAYLALNTCKKCHLLLGDSLEQKYYGMTYIWVVGQTDRDRVRAHWPCIALS